MLKGLIIFIITVLGLKASLNAQDATVVTGADAYGKSGSVNYTVGQIAYVTVSNTTGTEKQGIQQPFEKKHTRFNFQTHSRFSFNKFFKIV